VFAALLRRLSAAGMRRGLSGSRIWFVVAVVAGSVQLLRRIARDHDEVLYRTVVHPGDVFEVVGSAAPKS
jgi:hypothetical protein